MRQGITIRAALYEDLNQVAHLAKQLNETVVISESYISENFQRFVESEQHCLLVAIHGAAILGYASGYFHHAIYAGGLVAFVDEIVVDATYRSMKIGTLLMQRFEQVSVEKDCRIVALATFGARGFYEALGYRSKAGYFKKYL